MKQLILILVIFWSFGSNAKCVALSGVVVQQKFSSGEYLIQFRNGWTGLTAQSQRAKYDLAVLKPIQGFSSTGKFTGHLYVDQAETTVITIDGFSKKVPLFKEVPECK